MGGRQGRRLTQPPPIYPSQYPYYVRVYDSSRTPVAEREDGPGGIRAQMWDLLQLSPAVGDPSLVFPNQVFRHLFQPLRTLPVEPDGSEGLLDFPGGGPPEALGVGEPGDKGREYTGSCRCVRPLQQDFCDKNLIPRRPLGPPREVPLVVSCPREQSATKTTTTLGKAADIA